jgi:hypothetical protein
MRHRTRLNVHWRATGKTIAAHYRWVGRGPRPAQCHICIDTTAGGNAHFWRRSAAELHVFWGLDRPCCFADGQPSSIRDHNPSEQTPYVTYVIIDQRRRVCVAKNCYL